MLKLFACTDPTYKEWKQTSFGERLTATRRTDPTYKEWKLHAMYIVYLKETTHGSYLQGMETLRVWAPWSGCW